MICRTNAVGSKKTAISVTVTGQGTDMVGGTVTLTNGSTTLTGTTDSSGTYTTAVEIAGTWTIAYVKGEGKASGSITITTLGITYPVSIAIRYSITYTMSLNSTTMQTDPTACFAYANDCAGFTPVSNTETSLAKATTIGSWGFSDSTGLGPFEMFYATFTGSTLHQLLKPSDLTKYIAIWNGSSWDYTQTGNSSITSENTMLCIPTLYFKGYSGGYDLSDGSANGTAYASTIGGHTYNHLAIGVYSAYNSSGTLKSISGVLPTKSQTRATFRTQANANGTNWMLWNYHQWNLMRYLTFMVLKSFNGQGRIAYGGLSYESNTTGLCNALGPYAGSLNSGSSFKCLLENWWGSQYDFIDDFYGGGQGRYYAGQNAVPTDSTNNKTQVITGLGNGWWYGNTIFQNDVAWGIANASGGSLTTGLCDGQYGTTADGAIGVVGGSSDRGDNAGPSFLLASYGLSRSAGDLGARLAFVFDI